jgi:hypothetical protein
MVMNKETIMASHALEQSQVQTFAFHWVSPLGLAVALFLLSGLLYVLIGTLAPPLLRNTDPARTQILIISNRTDTQLFGRSPAELTSSDPVVAQLRAILLDIMSGLLCVAGLFQLAITWFGLRQGQVWALVVLAIGGLVALPFWFLALRPYLQEGIPLTLGDIPPFMWVPAVLLLPAIVLGWFGLVQAR